MRQLIREKLSEGWTAEEIKAYFAELYGDKVLTEPPLSSVISLNWLIYAVPLLFIFISFTMGIRYISRHLKKEV
jgi:cytochrome c-type biogenesis protein CcmH/NrfF